MEIESGKGNLTKDEVFDQAGVFIQQVEPYQTLILRIGMVAVPVLTILTCYLLIRKKYKIDEATYDSMVNEIERRKAS